MVARRRPDKDEIFNVAAELKDPVQRAAYLADACGQDSPLRAEIEELLDVDQEAGSFLARPAVDPPPTLGVSIPESPGMVIGPYKLRERIGEGGMGVVFVAERSEPYRQKVALKVIKPGMDTREVVARFEAERQALALMDHPNIAKVLDAGTTKSGRPYFVMELVRGLAITDYCDHHKLPVRKRLELFETLCHAVQHAHQKGIIHRDLKPSNVLVSHHDDKPMVKVIDFGVAKAVNQALARHTVYTRFSQIIGTLTYMSPEQAGFSDLDVDTRSDVYSMGVLLYELLTGTPPFDGALLHRIAYDEACRMVREQEPPKPSNRISTLGKSLIVVSQHRQTEPKKLAALVKGDLDWIVMRALEKDRTRRYDTASGFASDVRRYLNNEPIAARPPSTRYRLTRFAQRNRAFVCSSFIILLAVLIAVTAIVHENRQAKLARARAEDLQRQAEEHGRALEATINKYHSLLIESALLHAVLGDITKVQSTINAIQDDKFPEDWQWTLQGVAHLHAGDNANAISHLEKAIVSNQENVSAKAMLSLAYFHYGDWEKWIHHVMPLKQAEPRDEYHAFDSLFLGYAWFYIDSRESAERLRVLSNRHPTWVFPRMMLASALSHQAGWENSRQLVLESLDEIQLATLLAGDNPFMLMKCLSVYSQAIAIMGDTDGQLDQVAQRFAERLDRHSHYGVGSLVRAVYYERTGRNDRAKQAHHDVLEHGRGMMMHWPAAFFLKHAQTGDITSRDWHHRKGHRDEDSSTVVCRVGDGRCRGCRVPRVAWRGSNVRRDWSG